MTYLIFKLVSICVETAEERSDRIVFIMPILFWILMRSQILDMVILVQVCENRLLLCTFILVVLLSFIEIEDVVN